MRSGRPAGGCLQHDGRADLRALPCRLLQRGGRACKYTVRSMYGHVRSGPGLKWDLFSSGEYACMLALPHRYFRGGLNVLHGASRRSDNNFVHFIDFIDFVNAFRLGLD